MKFRAKTAQRYGFGDGKIVTYINGTQVHSYSDTGRNVIQRFGTPPAKYDRRFTVRPYAVYIENGIEYTVYGEYDVRYDLSILDIAKAFSEDPACAEDMKKILNDYENATAD